MNPFEYMLGELFANEAFTESAIIAGRDTQVICSPLGEQAVYTDFGMDEGVSFSLHVLFKGNRQPQKNDPVRFRRAEYKIAHVETDSANASWKIFLISRSTP